MRKTLALLLLSVSAVAQTLTMSGPTGQVRAGTSFTLALGIVNATNRQAIQFTLAGAAWPFVAVVGATQAGKVLDCSVVGAGINCVVSGGISNLVDGTLASFTFTLPRSASSSTAAITVTNPLAAYTFLDVSVTPNTQTATGAPVVAPLPFSLSITSSCAGITLVVAKPQIKGVVACSTAELNSDGKCDVLDLLILETFLVNGICMAR